MAGRLNPGIGERTSEQKRAASTERFVGQFQKTRIIAKDAMGKECQFEVLAILGGIPKVPPAELGAFWGTYVKKGDTYLQGGTVGGKTIEDIKVLDGKSNTGTLEGKTLWVRITGNGIVADGVLLPGFVVTNATCSAKSTSGATIPDNTLPTAKSPNGKSMHVEIGRWTGTTFLPSQQGHIYVGFCPSGYTISR